MKLCIDARPMQNAHRSRGVGVLLTNLLEALGRVCGEEEVTLITLKGQQLPPLFGHERRIETFRLERPNRFNWMADQLLLPGIVRQSGAEIFFATDFNSYLVPRGGTSVVSMAYDLIPFLFPEVMASQPLPVRWGWRTNFRKLRQSQAVIAISRATGRDLVNSFGVDPARISVVYPGIDHLLFNAARAGAVECRRELFGRLGIAGEYLLYVGDSEWRKNLKRVLTALAGIPERVKLVLVGKRAPTDATLRGWISQLGLEQRVVMTGYLPDADLPTLYGGARGFVFPSLYEGFGFPVVEAMASGCPVITSNVSSMPEVAGEAALLVDPESVDAIRQAMMTVIADSELRASLMARGVRRAAHFSWERAALETLKVLETVRSEK